jgi:hypothetical protein
LIISFNSANFALSALRANFAQAVRAKAMGSIGRLVFQFGAVLVFAQTGVVGLD